MKIDNIRGFTLTELLVSMAIFSVIIVLIYPTFSFIDQQSKIISDKQALQERGQRILNYIVSDLATAGFVVGSTQDVPYCSQTGVKVIQHSDGERYDSLTFITSKPVEIKINQNCITPGSTQPCVNNDYYLNVCQDASAGAIQITVDAALSCVKGIESTLDVLENGRSLIAFERASQINHAYTISGYSGSTISLSSALNLDIPQDSLVYTVRQYRYMVDDPQDPNATYPRTLRRVSWTKNCDEDPINIDEASGENGGVDALQFQYIYNDPVSGTQIVTDDFGEIAEIKDLRAIRVIMLIRSDGPERDYTDNNIYDLDGTLTVPLEFNDHYRRIELSKTVEVKSIAF